MLRPSDWAEEVPNFLDMLTPESTGSGVYLSRCVLAQASSFWQQSDLHKPQEAAANSVPILYAGSTARGFSTRVFEKYKSPLWRKARPSVHYRAIDAPDSTCAFFMLAKTPLGKTWEISRLAEAAAIAALNLFDSQAYSKYVQKHGVLPDSIKYPMGLNRTHALKDWAPSILPTNELADRAIQQVVSAGGRGVSHFRQTKEEAADGGRAAALAHGTNNLSIMIQVGRVAKHNNPWSLAGHKIKWPKSSTRSTKGSSRIWIKFSEKDQEHPHRWITDSGRPDLHCFAFCAIDEVSGATSWINPALPDPKRIEVAERIVNLRWRATLVRQEVQKEKRKK